MNAGTITFQLAAMQLMALAFGFVAVGFTLNLIAREVFKLLKGLL